MLNAVLKNHIDQNKNVDPNFVEKVSREFYIDDLVSGAQDVKTALELYHKVKGRMLKSGFSLPKWKSCDPGLTQMIEDAERGNAIESDPSKECELSYAQT